MSLLEWMNQEVAVKRGHLLGLYIGFLILLFVMWPK